MSLQEDFREKPERPGVLQALKAAWGVGGGGWEVAASAGAGIPGSQPRPECQALVCVRPAGTGGCGG